MAEKKPIPEGYTPEDFRNFAAEMEDTQYKAELDPVVKAADVIAKRYSKTSKRVLLDAADTLTQKR